METLSRSHLREMTEKVRTDTDRRDQEKIDDIVKKVFQQVFDYAQKSYQSFIQCPIAQHQVYGLAPKIIKALKPMFPDCDVRLTDDRQYIIIDWS